MEKFMTQFARTEKLIGKDALNKLTHSHVAVFGLGGVGSFATEALARAGVGELTLVDFDVVDETNLNRQLFALHSTIGLPKTEVARDRIADINPQTAVHAKNIRFDAQTANDFDFSAFNYVIDAVDTVTSKLLLAEICTRQNVPIISCMGTGNKLEPTLFEVADIFQTKVCPLAKVMRRELKRRGVTRLKVVYSEEEPTKPTFVEAAEPSLVSSSAKVSPASISFVPPVAGMILAAEVIKDLIKI